MAGNYTQLREDLPVGSRGRRLLDACTFSMSRAEHNGLRRMLPKYLKGDGTFSDDLKLAQLGLDP